MIKDNCKNEPDSEGCNGTRKNCKDKRCFPYCRGCGMKKSFETNTNYSLGIALIVLITIGIVIGAFYFREITTIGMASE